MNKVKGLEENSYTKGRRKPLLLAGLALVLLLAAVSCGGATERVAPEEPRAAVDLGPPSMGEEDAPVVLIEYSDLQ